jgi:hypothetical protein
MAEHRSSSSSTPSPSVVQVVSVRSSRHGHSTQPGTPITAWTPLVSTVDVTARGPSLLLALYNSALSVSFYENNDIDKLKRTRLQSRWMCVFALGIFFYSYSGQYQPTSHSTSHESQVEDDRMGTKQ